MAGCGEKLRPLFEVMGIKGPGGGVEDGWGRGGGGRGCAPLCTTDQTLTLSFSTRSRLRSGPRVCAASGRSMWPTCGAATHVCCDTVE